MKKLTTALLFAIIHLTLLAQSPQAIPYQAIIRNNDGSVMSDNTLALTFKIHENSANGTIVYEETHSTASNSQGLVSVSVGGGTPVTGNFNNINWGNGAKFLHVLMNTGNGDIDMGTQQMLSVPYALYAENSGSSSISAFQGNIGKGFTMISSSITPTTVDLPRAISFCYNLEEQGYNDWRLPTIEEVISFATINGPQNFTSDMWTLSIVPTNTLNFAYVSSITNNPSVWGYFSIYHMTPNSSTFTKCVR